MTLHDPLTFKIETIAVVAEAVLAGVGDHEVLQQRLLATVRASAATLQTHADAVKINIQNTPR